MCGVCLCVCLCVVLATPLISLERRGNVSQCQGGVVSFQIKLKIYEFVFGP